MEYLGRFGDPARALSSLPCLIKPCLYNQEATTGWHEMWNHTNNYVAGVHGVLARAPLRQTVLAI